MSFSPSSAPATSLPLLPPSPPPLINHHTTPPPLTTPFPTPISLPLSPPLPPPPTSTSEPPVVTSPLPSLPVDAPVPPVSTPPPPLPVDPAAPPVSTPLPPLPVDAPVPPVSTPQPPPVAIPHIPHVAISPSSTSSPLKSPPQPLTAPQFPITPSISSTSPSPFLHATSSTPPTVSPLPLKTSPPPLPTTSTVSPPPLGHADSPPIPPSTLVSPSPLPSSLITVPKSPGFAASPPLPLPLVNHSPPSTQRFHVSTGLIIGCVVGGVILLLVLGLLCLCYKDRRKKHRPGQDYSKPPICLSPKDKDSNFLSKSSQENVPRTGAHVITVLPKHLGPLRSQAACGSYVSRASDSVNPNKPQANSSVLSFASGTFTFNELVVATNDFSKANLLGEGGFGYVHKGVLKSGKEVAVKQLKTGSHQGELEFQAEVETISRIHHKHLVSLVGYCITGSQRLLVYEFVPNNSLEFHLHGKEQSIIGWETRLKIAIGSAKGLAYLHEDCSPVIIHRDIKASNILLDSKFEAKVSDFGLAKILPDTNTHISTRVVGTFGYLAPEYASSGKLTDKSDVYSYGIMLLELITGCPPISQINSSMNKSLVDWARPLLNKALKDGNFDGLVDPKLDKNYNYNEMEDMIACAAACVRHSAWLRPRMSQVVRALEGDVSLMKLDEAIRHGDSTIYTSSGSSNYDSHLYKDVMKLNMNLGKEYGISGCSESTSEYGLYPSYSSGKQTEI